jgi:hypothetical protein
LQLPISRTLKEPAVFMKELVVISFQFFDFFENFGYIPELGLWSSQICDYEDQKQKWLELSSKNLSSSHFCFWETVPVLVQHLNRTGNPIPDSLRK